jgi:putative protease
MASLPELLAPAGDWKNLIAALDAGADAVYFGVRGLNMRASAKNFTERDLSKLVETCHARKVRAYLTLNVLVFEKELPRLQRLLKAAKAAGVDGVIASDFAVISSAAKLGLEIHASTQMSVGNSAALLALHALGVRRFVLARECSLSDVRRIKATLLRELGKREAGKVVIEVFAHGAMCVSVSGRCFLSEHECGKSANRGACTQPCRREYKLVGDKDGQEWIIGQDYLLSPKDLCTLPFLEKLIQAGADSLKIEGRMRSPEYVSVVVGTYRKALDFYAAHKGKAQWLTRFSALKAELLTRLGTVYNRGFSSGFYLGKPIGEWTHTRGSVATQRKQYVGLVVNYFKKAGIAEILVQDKGFSTGDELLVEGNSTGFFRQKAESARMDERVVDRSEAGMRITLPMTRPVRHGDRLYIMR